MVELPSLSQILGKDLSEMTKYPVLAFGENGVLVSK